MSDKAYINEKVRREQIQQLFAGLPTSILAILFVSTALSAILWKVVEHDLVLTWWLLTVLVIAGRMAFYAFYRRSGRVSTHTHGFWEQGFLVGVVFSGVLWGMTSVLLFPPDITYQVIIAFVVAGMSAGAIATLSFQLMPIRMYLLLTLVPLIYRLVESESVSLNIMAMMVLMFLLLLMVSAKRIYKNYEQNIALNLLSVERENILEKNISALQSFHNISTNPQLTFDNKVQDFLKLGIKTFGMEAGLVSHIKNDKYTVKYMEGGNSITKVGDSFDVGQTFSGTTISTHTPRAFNNIGKSLMVDHPCFKATRIEAYIGSVITVDNQDYGTLSFISLKPRETEFSDYELMLVQLFAQWIGNEISRTEAEEKLGRFKTTLDLTQDCVFIFRPSDFRFIYVNQGAINQVGYTHDELLTMRPVDIKPDFDEQKFKEMIAPLLLGEKTFITFETNHLHKNGTRIPVEIFLQYIKPPGEEARFIAIVHDITERKRIEKMKDEFVSTVSHELRTPLTSIRGSIGLLLGRAMGDIPESQEKILAIANNNTERLLHLINDILDVQTIGSGKLKYEFNKIEVKDFLTAAIVENEGYAQEYKVYFRLNDEQCKMYVKGDFRRLMQVMANLLSNAAKFSSPESEVLVECRKENDSVRISVTDSGPGVPEKFRDRLFQKFSQFDSTDTRKPGGTGLGLSIARLIIEDHGGRIAYEPAKGGGASFYFELPLLDRENV